MEVVAVAKPEPDFGDLDAGDDIYLTKLGTVIPRTGKIFSFTFWRTQLKNDVFWSVQGVDYDNDGGAWIVTEYFGPPEKASRFLQEVTVMHPTEKCVQMRYTSTMEPGKNCVFISRHILQHFKSSDSNSFEFEFRILRWRGRPTKQSKCY
ncbi:PREDICTED: uncharacterized protein LOC108565147 isoform X2 [Nicrophorus vespilloides]|nr:PREDICTED: uncharacterized protein LOC108565147 isoform X2 [Nicrophorus vespilloides]